MAKIFDVKVSTAPASELISAVVAKRHMNVTHSDDDTRIGEIISEVREDVERYCGISIGSQTRIWQYDFDTCEKPIPYGPVIAVTGVTKRDDVEDYEALTTVEDYEVDGVQVKTIRIFSGGRCKVTYTCGYTTLPYGLQSAMLEEIAFRYYHRGDNNDQGGLSKGAREKLTRYRDHNWD